MINELLNLMRGVEDLKWSTRYFIHNRIEYIIYTMKKLFNIELKEIEGKLINIDHTNMLDDTFKGEIVKNDYRELLYQLETLLKNYKLNTNYYTPEEIKMIQEHINFLLK